MAKIIFINPTEPRCGVHQYGLALFDILLKSKKHMPVMTGLDDWGLTTELFKSFDPAIMIWNWHPLIASHLSDGPPRQYSCRHILVKHEDHVQEPAYDRVIFSAPQEDYRNVRHIGRPLPHWPIREIPPPNTGTIRVGCHGFGGAWAAQLATQLVTTEDVSKMTFNFHLPYSPYVDPNGVHAERHAKMVQQILCPRGGTVNTWKHFMGMRALIDWLSVNHVNCYIRDKVHWVGVSSALDAALVARRPIAINKCEAFRHFWDCKPSICLEDRSLTDIIASGDEPLAPLREKWSQANILAQIEKVIDEVL